MIPYVIEPSAGVDRGVLALLNEAYTEERLENDDTRIVLKFNPRLAPIKVAVIPLKKNNSEIVKLAHKIKDSIQSLKLDVLLLKIQEILVRVIENMTKLVRQSVSL